MENIDLTSLLDYIDPALLDYQDWINVGMALKSEGYDVSVWDAWSLRDPNRYHSGDCEKKWETFKGSHNPVTGATIAQMAKDGGWRPERESYALDWDDEIGAKDDLVIVNHNWLENKELALPDDFKPHLQLIKYLETLFEAGENVGYVVKSWEKYGKYLPANKGSFDRTAGQLIEELSKCDGDIGAVLGDYKKEAGAWIRFNPLDGKGVRDENITEYRYALVESDNTEIEKQNAIIRELELPVACLVHSGGKSLHAIVRIDAISYEEYRKKVDYLYDVCRKNGLDIDKQNRNPSRLSRMPGVRRGDSVQYIVDTNIGKASYAEWKEWIESVNDDLPDTETVADIWDNLPNLSPPLIDGILRQGHKMLIAGPSKAGKSFALIELCCSIAEGKPWLGFDCTQGKILYVNLELDRASCLHRFKDVYDSLGYKPDNLKNIDIWNLRGCSVPMDKLAPRLIRRASKKNYIAIIIDPIYKVITGDENSAEQMAHFCNQFDKVCTELGCAVIYCHHHSKGAQGGKRSMDRASGSGVFSRDPDALLDLIELDVTDAIRTQGKNTAVCKALTDYMKGLDLLHYVPIDDRLSEKAFRADCRDLLNNEEYKEAMQAATKAQEAIQTATAWRIEGTLREFPKFSPVNLWFCYPVHLTDSDGVLYDAESGADVQWNKTWKKNFGAKKSTEERKQERNESLETAFSAVSEDGKKAKISELTEYMGITEKTVRNHLKTHGDFWVDDGWCGLK